MAEVRFLKFASGVGTRQHEAADQLTLGGFTATTNGITASGGAMGTSATASFDWGGSGAVTATGNPTFNFGTGQADFGGNINASAGVDINADNQSFTIGAGIDLSFVHNGLNSVITNTTGDLNIDNTNVTGAIHMDLGTDTSATNFAVRNNTGTALLQLAGDGALTEAGLASINLTPTGTVSLRGGGVSDFGDDTGYISFNGLGAATETGITDFTITPTATLTLQGGGVSTFGDDTGTINFDGVGNVTETGMVSVNITPSSTLTLQGGGVSTFGDATGTIAFNGSGAMSTSGITTLDIDSSGALSLNSSAGVINVGNDAVAQAINIGTGAAARTITLGNANATLGLTGTLTVTGNQTVTGNLTVQGTTTTTKSETVSIADNHLYLNDGYETVSAETGGLVVNYLPTATNDTVAATGFVAGVVATSNPTVITTGSATFSASDFIQITGATNPSNDGLFEVLSHVGTTLTIRGIGTSGTVEDFTQNQFVTDTTVAGTIRKVTVAVIRCGTDGIWETASGSSTGLIFDDLGSATGNSLQAAYVVGNTITTSAGEGVVTIAGDQELNITATGGLNLDTILAFNGTTFDVVGTAISLDGTAASNFTVDSASLTLSTTTSGAIAVTSAGIADIDSSGALSLNSSAGAINVGNDAVAQSINIGTGAAARTITLGNITGATQMAINAGTGGLQIDAQGNSAWAIAGTVDIDSTGALSLNSSAGAINVGNDAVAQAVNIGTGAAARTITLGNATGATQMILDAGTGGLQINAQGTGAITIGGQADTGNINIGTSASARTIQVGNSNTTTGVNIVTGTSDANIAANPTAHITRVGSVVGAANTILRSGTGGTSVTSTAGIDIDAQGVTSSILNTLGTDTNATSFTVRNNTGASLMQVFGDGLIDCNVVGTTGLDVPAGTSFRIGGTALTTANFTAVNVDTLLNGSNADALHTHDNVEAASVAVTMTAGTGGVAAGDAVYVSAADTVLKCDANAIATSRCFGFAQAAILAAATGDIVVAGKVANAKITGLTLTVGAPVYLSLTAGEVDDTAPSATGDVVAEVGIAYTTTAFLLQVKAPIVLT